MIEIKKYFSADATGFYDLTIIIPAHNCEKYLDDAIKSAKSQVSINSEIIIIDDGSTDGTLNIALKYSADTSIKIISTTNVERSLARNIGLDYSSSEICIFLDADDLLHPLASCNALRLLKADENLAAVIYEANFFSDRPPLSDIKKDAAKLNASPLIRVDCDAVLDDRSPPINSVFFRKTNLRFSPGISVCEDWIFWKRLLAEKIAVSVPFKGCYVRRHGANSTNSNIYLIAGEILALHLLNKEGRVVGFENKLANRVGRLFFLSLMHLNPLGTLYHFCKGFAKALLKKISGIRK